jgi:hypothetical protein
MDHERFEIANLDLHKSQTGRKTEESRAMAVPLCFKRDYDVADTLFSLCSWPICYGYRDADQQDTVQHLLKIRGVTCFSEPLGDLAVSLPCRVERGTGFVNFVSAISWLIDTGRTIASHALVCWIFEIAESMSSRIHATSCPVPGTWPRYSMSDELSITIFYRSLRDLSVNGDYGQDELIQIHKGHHDPEK